MKDLGSDPAIKTTARDLKAALNAIKPDDAGSAENGGGAENGTENGARNSDETAAKDDAAN